MKNTKLRRAALRGYRALGNDVFLVGKQNVRPTTAILTIMFIAGAFAMLSWNIAGNVDANLAFSPSSLSNVSAAKKDGVATEKAKAIKDQILVKFAPNASTNRKNDFATKHGLNEKDVIKGIDVRIMTIPAGQDAQQVVDRMKKEDTDAIEFAEVDILLPPLYIPNDPTYPNQWHHPKIGSATAWDNAKGSGVTVAVLDTGTNCNHPDLIDNCVTGRNVISGNNDTSDIHGHGTKAAGNVAAVGENAIGVAGVAYQTRLMPIRITNSSDGYASYSAIAAGIDWATSQGVKVVTNSYASYASSAVQAAAARLKQAGGLFFAASGNNSSLITTPNSADIVVVGATSSSDARASWSNYGTTVDLAAPGVSVYSTTKAGGYATWSGTSAATPVAAAVAALIFSANSLLSPDQVQKILFDSATDLGASGWDQYYGWGRVNASSAVAQARETSDGGANIDTQAPTAPSNLMATTLSSSQIKLTWSSSTDNVGVTGYNIYRNGVKITTVTGTSHTDEKLVSAASYQYSIRALDAAGNISAASNIVTATTASETTATPFSIISSDVTTTSNSAVINWTTSDFSTGMVRYGLSKSKLTQSTSSSVSTKNHTVTISGLAKRTRYFYQIEATSSTGEKKISSVQAFQTKK